jgi:DNA-binding GntR family transcriptional regulator
MKKISTKNLEEFAYQSIIKLILENHFRPGDFLLETELAKSLELSRTPVRHALGQLVAEGFLDKKRKKGCFIPVPTPEDARNVFYVREHIEGLSAASAARYATDKDVLYLHDLIEKEKSVKPGGNKDAKMSYFIINDRFHLGIARMGRNKYIEQYCRHSFWRSHTYIFFFDKDYTNQFPQGHGEGHRQHIDIIKAIENRNEEKAGNLMRQHVRYTYEQLFQRI